MSDKILEQAETWLDEGRQVALATVVRTWGSSPRPVGSMMIVDQEGTMMGSVSGGCVEGEVIFQAQQALSTGLAKRLSFGISNDLAWQSGLTCGGQLDVFVEPIREA